MAMQRSTVKTLLAVMSAIVCMASNHLVTKAADTPGNIVVPNCQLSVMDTVTIASERVGKLTKVNAKLGQNVDVNELLIQLDDSVVRATLTTAEKQAADDIELRYAQKSSELSRLEYVRAKKLNQEIPGAVPDNEIQRLKLSAEKSLLQIEQAALQLELSRSRVDEIRSNLASYTIRSPMRGVVVKRHKNPGESVQSGEAILDIVGNDRYRIEGMLPLRHAWSVKSGDAIRVKVAIPNIDSPINQKTFSGTILLVEEEVSDISQMIRFVGVVGNKEGLLRSGLPATAEIMVGVPKISKR